VARDLGHIVGFIMAALKMTHFSTPFLLTIAVAGCLSCSDPPGGENPADAHSRTLPREGTDNRVEKHWDGVFERLGRDDLEDPSGFADAIAERLTNAGFLAPGDRVLMLAVGDGRNALPFAAAGLEVTGVDISSVALATAEEAARGAGLEITTVHADLFDWDLGHEQWDLVTNIFYNPAIRVFDRIKDAVRPGGFLLVEGTSSDHRGPGPPGWSRYREGQLEAELEGWEILVHERGPATSAWTGDRSVETVRLLARKPDGRESLSR
jgi:SAM-dependent methyltransferase